MEIAKARQACGVEWTCVEATEKTPESPNASEAPIGSRNDGFTLFRLLPCAPGPASTGVGAFA